MSFSTDELSFFRAHTDEVEAACARLGLTKATALADAALAREEFGEYGRAVVELAHARRSAQGKVPGNWWACHESAQQATPMIVAHLRARRIAQASAGLVFDATCSIGTEGHALRSLGIPYAGGDLDASRLVMARHNLGDNAWLLRADALKPAIVGCDVLVADPARRSGGRRIVKPEDLIPPLPDVIDAWGGRSELAIKCAPGLDFSEWDGLVSLVSVDGGVKEACLYSPGLAGGTRREALIAKRVAEGEAGGIDQRAIEVPGIAERYLVDRIDDQLDDDVDVTPPRRYIVDPDGAVVRAGLVRHYAHREGLSMLDPHIAYLTGDRLPQGTSGFPFIEMVPVKKLKAALRTHGCGSLEILVRGVDVDPDALRKKLGLKGKRQMSVVIARIGSQAQAFICGKRVTANEAREATAE